MVIDDNELVQSALKAYLEEDGFEVQTCPSANSAIVLAKERPFDIYIIDYRLPELYGDTVTAAIRRMQPSAIIIGSSMELKEPAFLSAGADTFISKEKLPDELSAFIRTRQAEITAVP